MHQNGMETLPISFGGRVVVSERPSTQSEANQNSNEINESFSSLK